MKLRKNDKKRAGVSLVTVLLFMLVATIAATATYKWITSEGHSSASRMMQREAYQSAVAGIENTRAWMTYNANDVGALITQYRAGGNKAIKISAQLKPWLRSGQDFDVWLTGVGAGTNNSFKMKFLSTGKGRDNTEHSEVAIFNVDGLYSVTVPAESGNMHFDKAFQGEVGKFVASDAMESAIVNGDFKGNMPKIEKNMIVTGDVTYEGTNTGKGDLYVKGDVSNQGALTFGIDGVDTSAVYIGGDLSCAGATITVHGDLYIGGVFSCNCKADVKGNFTVGGTLCNDGDEIKVGKNWVFTETGKINNEKADQAGNFNVTKNVYLPKELEAHCDQNGCYDEDNGNRKATFSGKIYQYSTGNTYYIYYQKYYWWGNTIYPRDSYKYGAYANIITSQEQVSSTTDHCADNNGYQKPGECKRWRLFSIKASEGALQTTDKVTKWAKDDGVLKDIGDNYWYNIDKLSKYGKLVQGTGDNAKVPIAVQLKNESDWKDHPHKCDVFAKVTVHQNDGTTFIEGGKKGFDTKVVEQINDCYTDNADKLYNGFLVLDLKDFKDGASSTTKLKGNFVFIMSGSAYQLKIPPTEPDAVVMLYFPQGWGSDIEPAQKSAGNEYNYFIYSNGTISQFISFSNVPITGSVVLASGKLNTSQGGTDIKLKQSVLDALGAAGFIQDNPEYVALTGEGGGQGQVITGTGFSDDYLIAASPMLNVTLVSQYENKESVAGNESNTELSSSYIVLPRVIRMPKNPHGKLSDYYDIVNLNGGNYVKDPTKGVCSGIPVPPNLLYDRKSDAATELTPGTHKCTYTPANGTPVKFYVNVTEESLDNVAYVYFDKSYQPMGKNTTAYVSLVYPEGSNEEFKVRISKPSGLAGTPWSVTPAAGATYEGDCDDNSTSCVFKLNYDGGSPKNLFEVKTTNAENGTYVFDLDCVSGCAEGSISTKTFSISSVVNIARGSLQEYCNLAGVTCSEEYTQMTNLSEWPDCTPENGSTAWIKAVSYNSETTSNCSGTNNSWTCGISGDIKLVEVENGVPQGCRVVIPSEKNTLPKEGLVASDDYTLYGVLKAKKYTFHVGFDGNDYAGKTINVISTKRSINETCSGSTGGGCDYELFTGDDIKLVVDDNDFSYWKCDPSTSSANCLDAAPFTGNEYEFPSINGENSVIAWFGQRDKHCFFDEFKTTRECTGEGTEWKYCFNYCSGSGECRIGNGELTYNAKWLVIGDAALRQKLNYEGGKIWLDNSYNSHKKQSDIQTLKVMSTVQAGLYGALVGQFQVPRMGRNGDKTSAQVNKSGFMLRSNDAGTQYLLLNVYANRDGKLAVNACVGDECSDETLLSKSPSGEISVKSTDIVTLTAEIKKNGSKDELHLSAVDGYYGSYQTATAVINLSNISGYSSLTGSTHEYVGFSLADPDFKVYDLGWKSEDYNAECWETAPTIKCSFRAAYLGGIVPLNKEVTPWVGFSSWFNGKNCEPQFQYKGNDACGQTTDSFSNCDESYTFTASGAHGSDDRMAQASVGECSGSYLLNTERALAYTGGSATCGTFWVGETKPCRRSFEFYSGSQTIGSGSDHDFALGSGVFATLRDATIKIEMDNSSESELEVYLKSETESAYYGSGNVVYSKSATVTAKTEATIDVMELANEAGFDPERVFGVLIKNHGTSSVTITKVYSVCDGAMKLECQDLRYSGGKFQVQVKVPYADNSVTKYEIAGKEAVMTESGDYGTAVDKDGLSKEFECPGTGCPDPDGNFIVVLESKSYNPYESDGIAKQYTFAVNVYDKWGEVEDSPCDVDMEMSQLAAECRWSNGSSVQPGRSLPDFQYKLADCGGGNCEWVIKLDGDTEVHSGSGTTTNNNQFSSIPQNKRTAFNTETSSLEVGEHTMSFENKSNATTKFVGCELKFNVTNNVRCEFTSPSGTHSAGDVTLSPTVSGCDNNCLYSIDGGEYGSSLTVTHNYAGSYTHSVSVKRGSEDPVSCDGTYTVNIPLGGSCWNNGSVSGVTAGADVQPPTPDISLCNGECRYSVTGPASSDISDGTGYNYGGNSAPNTFKDNASGLSGQTVTYTWNVWRGAADGLAAAIENGVAKTCDFDVTYTSASSGSVTATCYFDPATTYMGYTNNGCAASFKAKDFSGAARDIVIHLYNGSNEIPLCDNAPCKHHTGGPFTYCIPTAFSSKGSVTYTLKDGSGNNICDPQTLTIAVPKPTCSATPNPVTANNAVTFSVTAWNPATMDYSDVKLYYDDGSTPTKIKEWDTFYGNASISFAHIPTTAGEKTYTLKGFDSGEILCEETVTVNPGVVADYTFNSKNDRHNIPAGTHTILVNPGQSVAGCQFFCNASGHITVNVGGDKLEGDYYIGGSVDPSVCSGTSSITLSADGSNCGVNYW